MALVFEKMPMVISGSQRISWIEPANVMMVDL